MSQPGQPAVPRHRFSLTGLLEVACVLALLATLSGFLARIWWVFELSTHFRPHYAGVLLAGAGFWLWQRRPRWALTCGTGFLLNALVILTHGSWVREAAPAGGSSVRFVSLNVHTANERFDRVLGFLRKIDADVVLLMEVNDRWVRELEPWAAQYPQQLIEQRDDNFGIALFSRLPWTNAAVVALGSAEVPTVSANLELDDGRLHLVGTHPLPPGSAEYAAQRNEQLRALADHTRSQTAPTVVLGDLNTTQWSPFFRALHRQGGLRAPSGLHAFTGSWPAVLPIGRIQLDHCLMSRGVVVEDIRLGPAIGSDHLPLIANLRVHPAE
jgi:endonuclease/exonuclease/phosphatase (EEP) superfamily protein YafD